MRLADFLEQQMPAILETWDSFAATLAPAADRMDAAGLRDHAEQMLEAIALDLRSTHTVERQLAESRGERASANAVPQTAAEIHAVLRATGGFTIRQVVSEYRALRASVLSLYAQAHSVGPHTLADIGRFNEAVDQAVAQSVASYSMEVERWRNVFLSILGHDLRGPLNAILLSSREISLLAKGARATEVTERLVRSGQRMQSLLDELLEYNRSTLGVEFPVKRTAIDLAACCLEEIELRRAAHPDHPIKLLSSGSVEGSWDPSRIKQALGNLIANAARYGTPGGTIWVELRSDETQAHLSVKNAGHTLSPDALSSIFEPLRRIPHLSDHDRTNLGLGLFVVGEVARAHGGTATVESANGVTVFSLHLPRT